MSGDAFGLDEPERDRWNRPLIKAPGAEHGEPYTRASSFADALDDKSGLTVWKLRHAAIGVARDKDLQALLAGLDPSPQTKKDRAVLNDLLDRAHAASAGNHKADHGTAVHTFTEPDNPFTEYMPEHLRADVASYEEALKAYGVEVVDTESFGVDDRYRVAGTRDHVYRLPQRIVDRWAALSGESPECRNVVADKKTGKFHPNDHAVQLGIYAHILGYDDSTGERTEFPGGIRTDFAVVAHIPKGEGVTVLHRIDIRAGYEVGARLASEVRAWRDREDLAVAFDLSWLDKPPAEVLHDLIEAAQTDEELADLWTNADRDVWGNDHTRHVVYRRGQLTAA